MNSLFIQEQFVQAAAKSAPEFEYKVFSHYYSGNSHSSEYVEELEEATGIAVWVEKRNGDEFEPVDETEFPCDCDDEWGSTVVKAQMRVAEMCEKYNCTSEFY